MRSLSQQVSDQRRFRMVQPLLANHRDLSTVLENHRACFAKIRNISPPQQTVQVILRETAPAKLAPEDPAMRHQDPRRVIE